MSNHALSVRASVNKIESVCREIFEEETQLEQIGNVLMIEGFKRQSYLKKKKEESSNKIGL